MATLVYSDSDGRDHSFALGADPVMVGRSMECAIRSDDPRVSRMHARFFVEGGALWVEDLGSANGIYVGPNRVQQRAPVPTGEIILVGSLMIRLLPASGTLPPPVGLHGTLATWLDQERKARAAVEEERDAFARRVNEMHQEIADRGLDSSGDTMPGLAAVDALRLRDESEARAAALEATLGSVQDELMALREAAIRDGGDLADLVRLRGELAAARERSQALERDLADRAEWSPKPGADQAQTAKLTRELERIRGALDEAEAARSVAEHAAGEAMRDAQVLRDEMVEVKRATAEALEVARIELEKTREAQIFAETAVGVVAAERLADSDRAIAELKRELAEARAAKPEVDLARVVPMDRHREVAEQVTTLTGRAEKAEKDLAAAQIRAQGAERNLTHATSQATKAEARAAQLEQQATDAATKAKTTDEELGKARERLAAFEARAGAGEAPRQAAEARATKLAAELKEMTGQFEARRDRVAALEKTVAAAGDAATAAETKLAAAKTELVAATGKLAEAEARAAGLQKRVGELDGAEAAIASAAKARDDAAARVSSAEARARDAERRTEDAEKRASAADTMAKAMAKDVAEALRRAVDSDTRTRSLGRELGELTRRAEAAESKQAQTQGTIGDAEQRAAEAEARVAKIEAELGEQLAAAQKAAGTKLEAREKELTVKLEAGQRELAAERSTAMSLVDRKTQLERELADLRAQLAAAVQRAETSIGRAAEHEVQIETLQDRIDDLESGIAVAETAHQASLAEVREQTAALEKRLADATAAAEKGGALAEQLRAQVADLEKRLAEATAAQAAAEEGLRDARSQLGALERALEERTGSATSDRDQLEDALARANDAERKMDALTARAETADLAIGRAGALQRQLDEALSKLAWLEREQGAKKRDSNRMESVGAVATDRLREAEARLEEVSAALREAELHAREAEARLVEADRRAQLSHDRGEQLAAQVGQLERRAARADEQTRAAEAADRRAREAEARLADAEQRVQTAGGAAGQLAALQARLVELERENEAAENVRSFAAETEREIAQLQRELRENRAKLAQMTLERDRLASELGDARNEDGEVTSPHAVADRKRAGKPERDHDPDATGRLDVGRYEAMLAKTTELEKQVQQYQRDEKTLRARLADTEERLREAIDGSDDGIEMTHTGGQLPLELAEHVNILEESIDSLRADMRAASDETAMMDQTDSVIVVSTAVSSAAEHIERARAAVRALASSIGMA